MKAEWDGDAPPSTTLTAQARAGTIVPPDNTWSPFSTPSLISPLDLSSLNGQGASWLQIQFDLATQDRAATPRLKSFRVWFECGNNPG